MRQTLKGTIYITLALAGMFFSTPARAGHATNFLDALQSEVTNRIVTATNLSKAERRALSSAAHSLNRNTKTLAADLGALASAAGQLDAKFSGDETFAELEANAIVDYSDQAHARLDGVDLWLGTNVLSRRISNALDKATSALERADATTNSVPAHAHALASAFNKILPFENKVHRLFNAPAIIPPVVVTNPPSIDLPTPVAPGTPGLAPDSVGHANVDLHENAIVNDQTIFYFSTAQTGAQIYSSHNPEELGLWTYIRTGANAAVFVVTPNYPNNAPSRLLNLTFTSATAGTFTATTYYGDTIVGTFAVIQ